MKNSISKSLLRFITVILVCFVAHQGTSQVLVDDTCPYPNSGKLAYATVKLFLILPHKEDWRIETGATNETVDQIRPVANENICSKLNEIVRGNALYKEVDDTVFEKLTKYYYRTDNLYYIFWERKPEYDNPHFGPKRLFIVVSKDYNTVWQYYY